MNSVTLTYLTSEPVELPPKTDRLNQAHQLHCSELVHVHADASHFEIPSPLSLREFLSELSSVRQVEDKEIIRLLAVPPVTVLCLEL